MQELADRTIKENREGTSWWYSAYAFIRFSNYYVGLADELKMDDNDVQILFKKIRSDNPQLTDYMIGERVRLIIDILNNDRKFYLKEAADARYKAGDQFEWHLSWESALLCYKRAMELDPENKTYQEAYQKLYDKITPLQVR